MAGTAKTRSLEVDSIDAASLSSLQEMTEEFFDSPATLESEFDPENPSDRWIAVVVAVSGGPREISDRMDEWHRRVDLLCPEIHDHVRLAAYVP